MLRSYDHGGHNTPLIGETIGENLTRSARRFPLQPAIVSCDENVRMTYREFDHAVDGLATALIESGLERGDRVGMWAPNCVAWPLIQYATARAGVILVNVNPAYRSHELEFVVRQSGLRLLISAAEYKTSDYRSMAQAAHGSVDSLERVVILGEPEWDDLATTASDPQRLADRLKALSFDDAINIQYTSGTTGAPKGATLTHHNILNNGFFTGELLRITEADRMALPVPFYHAFGMVMGNLAATTHGACVVVPSPTFAPETALRAVHQERCTSLYGVPTMFIAMLEHPDFAEFDLSSLRTGVMAGAPCPIEVMRRVAVDMHMSEIAIAYGMTETSPVSTMTRIDDPLDLRVATVGRAGPHVEVKVARPDTGLPVPRGERGEFCTRGYSVMRGYWDEPQMTADAIDDDGWMHTGDLATMDEEGNCAIVGRIKDMVIRGGENIYPREIEEFLHAHPDIADVQVVGVPDPRYGEELCACVVLRAGASVDEDAIRTFCAGRIAHYKVPRYLLVLNEFPMTVTGKVQKYVMRESAIDRLGLRTALEDTTA